MWFTVSDVMRHVGFKALGVIIDTTVSALVGFAGFYSVRQYTGSMWLGVLGGVIFVLGERRVFAWRLRQAQR